MTDQATNPAPSIPESEQLTPAEILEEQEAEQLENEREADEEAAAEEEELNSPMDAEDEEGWEHNIERLND